MNWILSVIAVVLFAGLVLWKFGAGCRWVLDQIGKENDEEPAPCNLDQDLEDMEEEDH